LIFIYDFTEKSEATRSGGCFDGNSVVYTKEGVLPIRDVQIGDEILSVSSDGSLQFSEVLMFLDREPNGSRLYYEIETESGSKISLTPSHLLFVADDNTTELSRSMSRVSYAKNVQTGQFLYTSSKGDNKSMTFNQMESLKSRPEYAYLDRVVSFRTRVADGAYAPLTRAGNLIVNNVIASCYAVINDQSVAHLSFLPIRLFQTIAHSFQELAYLLHVRDRQSDHKSVSSHQIGVHWYPKLLYSLSKYIVPSDKMY
jgi:hypothetical protein